MEKDRGAVSGEKPKGVESEAEGDFRSKTIASCRDLLQLIERTQLNQVE